MNGCLDGSEEIRSEQLGQELRKVLMLGSAGPKRNQHAGGDPGRELVHGLVGSFECLHYALGYLDVCGAQCVLL